MRPTLSENPPKAHLPGKGAPSPSHGEGGSPFEPGRVQGTHASTGGVGVPASLHMRHRSVGWARDRGTSTVQSELPRGARSACSTRHLLRDPSCGVSGARSWLTEADCEDAGDLGQSRDALQCQDRVCFCRVRVPRGSARDEPDWIRFGQDPDEFVPCDSHDQEPRRLRRPRSPPVSQRTVDTQNSARSTAHGAAESLVTRGSS